MCLGNRYGSTAPDSLLTSLAACLGSAMGLRGADIALNAPYQGGYISRYCGQRPLPWIQVEFSRALYMQNGSPWPGRVEELNGQFGEALLLYFGC